MKKSIKINLSPERRAELRKLREKIHREEKPRILERLRKVKAEDQARRAQLAELFTQLKSEREKNGLSLADMSERTGMGREAISRLENLVNDNPKFGTILRYAEAIGVKLSLRISG